jgi:lipopolysaccharide transport system ATP-binding protein
MIKQLKANRALRKLLGKSAFTLDNLSDDSVVIGDYTYGRPAIHRWTNKHRLVIGRFCSISEGVKIIVDGNHRLDWVTTYPFGELLHDVAKNPDHPIGKGDMKIGNDVWIGMNATILPGVQIADGAVIGAGAVVVKDVLPYEVVGGNPAKHIAFRFSAEQILALMRIAWWDWDLDKIKREVPILQSEKLSEFIRTHDPGPRG